MRVAVLVPAYPPRSRVGAWVATHAYLVHLAACGHHVDVFTHRDHSPVGIVDGVTVGPGTNPAVLDTAFALADVVISHVGDTVKAAGLAAKWGKPNVRMAHGKIEDEAALEGASLVVFNSANLAASISDCPSPSIVCRPPVDAAKFRTTPGDRVTLVNLAENKGGELFWRLVRCAPHRRFLAVKGAYGNQYLEEAPNALLVPTTANMRDDVFARTRILLMPSERETWGMTGVEAMSSGIPVIAHPTDGLIESLGPAGIFVDRADGQAWLDEIERLHDSVEWAVASRRAVARSAELDPQPDLDRFLAAVESLHCTGVPA